MSISSTFCATAAVDDLRAPPFGETLGVGAFFALGDVKGVFLSTLPDLLAGLFGVAESARIAASAAALAPLRGRSDEALRAVLVSCEDFRAISNYEGNR